MSNYKESYLIAKQRFADLGIDTELAMQAMADLPVSMHCWQGDDVAGFEKSATALSGGIQATGNYPGKATNAIELRADMDKAMSLIPALNALTCTLFISKLIPPSNVMKLNLAILPIGLIGRKKTISHSILTLLIFPIHSVAKRR